MHTTPVTSLSPMPPRDFQQALAEFGQRMQARVDNDEVFGEALRMSQTLIAVKGPSITANVTAVLAGLAAVLALELQDYVSDALTQVVQGTPDHTWNILPQTTRDLLQEMWPQEGGLTFLGKIGVAVVSEGFWFP